MCSYVELHKFVYLPVMQKEVEIAYCWELRTVNLYYVSWPEKSEAGLCICSSFPSFMVIIRYTLNPQN